MQAYLLVDFEDDLVVVEEGLELGIRVVEAHGPECA